MKIRDYFLLGLSKGLDKKRHWVNNLISLVVEDTKITNYDYKLIYEKDELFFYEPETNEKIYITDYIPGRELIHFRDPFILNKGDVVNYRKDETTVTTYGNVFVNNLCLLHPGIGHLVDFPIGTVDFGVLENIIFEKMVDNSEDGSIEEGKISVSQYLLFAEYALSLTGYAIGLITPLSKKALLGHPERIKVRNDWMEANKDRLDDPTAIAELNDILDELDQQWLSGDPAQPYYNSSSKLIGARRMVHYTTGAEAGFGDGTTVDFIPKSLQEGIDMTKLSAYNNSTRTASYNRGHQTALGGESTKIIYRMVGNVMVAEADCKSKVGMDVLVTKYNIKDLVGYTMLINKEPVLITKENIEGLFGSKIEIRSPATCKTSITEVKDEAGRGKNVCAVCAGTALSENPNGIPAAAAGVGGVFLTNFLKMMHNTELKVAKWNFNEKIT